MYSDAQLCVDVRRRTSTYVKAKNGAVRRRAVCEWGLSLMMTNRPIQNLYNNSPPVGSKYGAVAELCYCFVSFRPSKNKQELERFRTGIYSEAV